MNNFYPKINENLSTPKFLQLVESIENAVQNGDLEVGDALPSVNDMVKECSLSRDTVFKAYSELKARKVIESVRNKGYYICDNSHRIFLLLDTFKAYKEVLFGAFRDALPMSYKVDIHFHHYNAVVFRDTINNAIGKYSHYIVMNFDHPKVASSINKIDASKLLCIDWKVNLPSESSFVGQDFGQSVYDNLLIAESKLRNYQKLIFVYPTTTYHPKESILYFENFCKNKGFNYEVLYDESKLDPQKGELYFTVSDRILAKLLDFIHDNHFILGTDLGIISYNETPTKKYIKDGISVISTDFETMGMKIASFVSSGIKIDEFIPTKFIDRASL